MRSARRPDALDLLEQEAVRLRELFALWDATQPQTNRQESLVDDNFEHGTVGKLLLEHAALYLAACREVAANSGSVTNSARRQIDESSRVAWRILDELDEMARAWMQSPSSRQHIPRRSNTYGRSR